MKTKNNRADASYADTLLIGKSQVTAQCTKWTGASQVRLVSDI